MTDTSHKPAASNPLLRALGRWENEGGSPRPLAPDFDHDAILLHLGTAVMMRWSTLPREIQRELFVAAVELDEPAVDGETVRAQIAVFLHQHLNDERSIDRGGES